MDYHYSIVNQCLQLLKQSEIPTIKKLRVEIQLIQMKRLLLNQEKPKATTDGSCGEAEFEGLLSQMRKVCAGNCEAEALTLLMHRIGCMLALLGGEQLTQ